MLWLGSLADSFWPLFFRMDRLYWVDSLLDQIGHIDLEGNDRQMFTDIGQITQPYSLTVYSGEFQRFAHFQSIHGWLTLDYYQGSSIIQ